MADEPKPAVTPAVIQQVAAIAKAVDPPKADVPAKVDTKPPKMTIPDQKVAETKPTETEFVYKTKEEADAAFHKMALEKGYIKKPIGLTTDQKVVRGALVSFGIMAVILFFKWIAPFVVGNDFIGTWQDVLVFLETLSVLFTQVVLAKIKQAYTESKEQKV